MNVPSTSRLSFRLLDAMDAGLLFELDQDPQVMRFLTHGHCTTLHEIQARFLPRLASYTSPEQGWGLWGSFLDASKGELAVEFVGWILVRPVDFFSPDPHDDSNLEIGWRFKRRYWGKGLATEAALAVTDALSRLGNCRKFTADTMKDNLASVRVMKKLGMNFVREFEHSDEHGDAICVRYEKSISQDFANPTQMQ